MARGVLPNGAKVRELRMSRGWTAEELAGGTGVSVKTVNSIESGRRVYLCSLHKVANKLGVPTAELVLEDPPHSPGLVPDDRPRPVSPITFTITLGQDYYSFDQTELVPLIQRFATAIKAAFQIDVLDLSDGNSIDVVLGMAHEDVLRTVNAYLHGELAELQVEKIGKLDAQVQLSAFAIVGEDGKPIEHFSMYGSVITSPLRDIIEQTLYSTMGVTATLAAMLADSGNVDNLTWSKMKEIKSILNKFLNPRDGFNL